MTSTSAGPRHPLVRVIDCHVARRTPSEHYEYLLLRRAKNKIYAGSWRMVGGKLSPDEPAWRGALRELREETGLIPQRILTVPYVNRFYEWEHDRINDIPVFVAVAPATWEPSLDAEHAEHRWLPLGEATAELPWPGQKDGLRAADALLHDTGPLPGYLEVKADL